MKPRTYAQQLAAAAEATAKRARHQRFTWCRLRNDFIDMPLWRVVAARLDVPLHLVQAFVIRLESLANGATPRGFVGDFDQAEFGAALGVEPMIAANLYAELEQIEIGWIVQDHVATFWERNPDKEDNTAAERMRRKRARDKQLRETAAAERAGLITAAERAEIEAKLRGEVVHSYGVTGVTLRRNAEPLRRDSVTLRSSVTSRPEQSRDLELPPVDYCAGSAPGDTAGLAKNSDEAPADDPQAADEAWLQAEGLRIVIERMTTPRPMAEMLLERWKRDLPDGAAALKAIIEAADTTDYRGARFHVLVTDQLARRQREARGPQLPLVTSIRGGAQ